MKKIKALIKKLRHFFLGSLISSNERLADLVLQRIWWETIQEPKNPLNRYGAKYFSQADEDGITLEILRRIGLETGTFAEFGVGNGSENNTLILIAHKWKGFWVGNQELFFKYSAKLSRFAYLKTWVVRENLVTVVKEGLAKVDSQEVDVISFDLDMNDIYFLGELLNSRVYPKLFIVEYNAKFPPPIRWQVEYDPSHQWRSDDYHGASLQSLSDCFNAHGYTLVCCNAYTGVNAFFVLNDYLDKFQDVPKDIKDIYHGPRTYASKTYGHRSSPRTVERMLQLNELNET